MLEVIERKVATFKPKISSLELLHQENVKTTTFQQEISNLKPDSYYLDLMNKQVAKKMVVQSNEIASINSKIASLEKVVTQHTTTLDHDLVGKVNKLETEVAKKLVGQSNGTLATKMNSTNKKIAEIEQSIQNTDKLSTELKHLGDKVTQVKNTSDSNTYMIYAIHYAVYLTQGHPKHHKFKLLSDHITRNKKLILKEHPDYWAKVLDIFHPERHD